MNGSFRAAAMFALAAVLCLSVMGCGGYVLQGRVLAGPDSYVEVVGADSSRLEMADPTAGIPGASVRVTIDPGQGGSKRLPLVQTNPDGTFAVAIHEPGAGLLHYEVEVVVRYLGHSPAVGVFALPLSSQRVLATMRPGRDHSVGEDEQSPDELIERYWDPR